MKYILAFLFSFNLFACPYNENQMDFYLYYFETHNDKTYHSVPKYNNCPTKITELDLSFMNRLSFQLRAKEYIVSNHVRENILDENYMFAPLIIIKN